jgi:GxxExxY protein
MMTQIRETTRSAKGEGRLVRGKDQLTERIIGCCFQVHRELGPGFPEKVYRSALTAALKAANLSVECEQRFSVMYQQRTVGEFRVDTLVERRVVVEVKAITGLMPKVFAAQLLAYLKAANIPVGLLVNFGNASCQVKRMAAPLLAAER